MGYMKSILAHFPCARFVLTTRDPRDNLVSLLARYLPSEAKDGIPRNSSVARWTSYIAKYGDASLDVDALPLNTSWRVRLEDLQSDCYGTMSRVHAWLGLRRHATTTCSNVGAGGVSA